MKVKSFIKQFAAILKGDTAEVVAQKTYRQASSGLKTQIAKLQGDTLTYEDRLEAAKEAAANALLNNGKEITDREEYVKNLITTDNNLNDAEEALADHLRLIQFLEGKLAELDAEEDAA